MRDPTNTSNSALRPKEASLQATSFATVYRIRSLAAGSKLDNCRYLWCVQRLAVSDPILSTLSFPPDVSFSDGRLLRIRRQNFSRRMITTRHSHIHQYLVYVLTDYLGEKIVSYTAAQPKFRYVLRAQILSNIVAMVPPGQEVERRCGCFIFVWALFLQHGTTAPVIQSQQHKIQLYTRAQILFNSESLALPL